jgi:hypothetical protein
MKKYHLQYEFLGVPKALKFNTLFEFLQKLDEITNSSYVDQQSISFRTEEVKETIEK